MNFTRETPSDLISQNDWDVISKFDMYEMGNDMQNLIMFDTEHSRPIIYSFILLLPNLSGKIYLHFFSFFNQDGTISK